MGLYNNVGIQANENMDDWNLSPAIVNETVSVARDFLNDELRKYDTWEELKEKGLIGISDLFEGHVNEKGELINPKAAFGQAKGEQGIGYRTVAKFLGKNWKGWKIKDALNTSSLL